MAGGKIRNTVLVQWVTWLRAEVCQNLTSEDKSKKISMTALLALVSSWNLPDVRMYPMVLQLSRLEANLKCDSSASARQVMEFTGCSDVPDGSAII